jgi:hypothetical protein
MTWRCLIWDWCDWSLSRRKSFSDGGRCWVQVFALRCGLCKRWALGCKDHWFCGMCEDCRYFTEHDPEAEP